MASALHAGYAALIGLAFWSALGYPLARRLLGAELGLPLAPFMGWAVHSVVAVPVFLVLPWSAGNIVCCGALGCLASVWVGLSTSRAGSRGWNLGRAALERLASVRTASEHNQLQADESTPSKPRIPGPALLGALVLALVCAAAIAPKQAADGVFLSDQIFDHAKVAIIDDIARLGMPPGNPFIAHDGGNNRLAYYYLYYFSAAELTRLLGITGWEADLGMTFFCALTSLCIMMALAVRICDRQRAAYWVLVLAASSPWRLALDALLGESRVDAWLPAPGGFGGWLFQSSWVPQHLAGTSCVLCSVLLMQTLRHRSSVLTSVILALMLSAGFETSSWIGGVTFAFACLAIVPVCVLRLNSKRRFRFLVSITVAAVLAVLFAWPFLVDQAAATAHRQARWPIAIHLFPVLGSAVPRPWSTWLDGAAFWLMLLPAEFGIVYLAGLGFGLWSGLEWLIHRRKSARPVRHQTLIFLLAALAAGAGWVAWLLASTLADNNDLAWRAILLAATAMIVLSASALDTWIEDRRWTWVMLCAGALVLGLPGTLRQCSDNLFARPQADARQFAEQPALWQAVREHSSGAERIASNPSALKDMTPWPVNIGWSLFAQRRSCYAGWELTQVYSSVPHAQLYLVDVLFKRVFAGQAEPADVEQLAQRFDCQLAVLTPADGAWTHDPFRLSTRFKLVDEQNGRWRIYRRTP